MSSCPAPVATSAASPIFQNELLGTLGPDSPAWSRLSSLPQGPYPSALGSPSSQLVNTLPYTSIPYASLVEWTSAPSLRLHMGTCRLNPVFAIWTFAFSATTIASLIAGVLWTLRKTRRLLSWWKAHRKEASKHAESAPDGEVVHTHGSDRRGVENYNARRRENAARARQPA